MNKEEFLNSLRKRLKGLPNNEIEERISFYSEMIDDRVEEGMSEEEAILQMEMLGHDFFVFKDSETSRICILYKRKDNNYGLIETE